MCNFDFNEIKAFLIFLVEELLTKSTLMILFYCDVTTVYLSLWSDFASLFNGRCGGRIRTSSCGFSRSIFWLFEVEGEIKSEALDQTCPHWYFLAHRWTTTIWVLKSKIGSWWSTVLIHIPHHGLIVLPPQGSGPGRPDRSRSYQRSVQHCRR